jgi:hypothetical protein
MSSSTSKIRGMVYFILGALAYAIPGLDGAKAINANPEAAEYAPIINPAAGMNISRPGTRLLAKIPS